MLSFALAIIPPILILLYYWRQDQRRPEPKGLILKVFLIGCVSVIPLGLFEMLLMQVVGPLPFWPKVVLEAFIIAALVEEFGKRWVVRRYAYGHRAFDEIHDGVLYTIVASLGFAALENILYSVGDPSVALLRAFTAVPMHALASGLMGYYIGLAKFSKSEPERRAHFAKGLGAATGFHGVYDFFLMSQTLLAALVLPLLIWGFFHLRGRLAHVQHLDRTQLDSAA